ncbi:MAG: ATP-binding cassette domain-containing protein [Bacteroidaceae bacterium]|nr:ATP-binding cassette domain-containing protein [Candidatus Colenecus caballi]MCQ2073495.1 ATP-binding cassette domain-containing protein [Bacteroidaceae bacterium]
MITIKELGFSYGSNVVLKDISLNLEEGRIYGLLGENGVGKTTLLTLLAGLKKTTSGTIDIDGRNPFDRQPSLLSNIYYLPDEVPAPRRAAIGFARDNGQYWEKFDLTKFSEIMKVLDTDENQRMDHMSYGQLKKTMISFALATNARYMFMDEPTNGLDIPSKAQFRKAVSKYTSDESTLLISTHQARDLEAIIDPIIILDRQDVLLNASIGEITEKLYFDYGTEIDPDALYSEMVPGGCIQVTPNPSGAESKVNIEALFNAVLLHKSEIKEMFNK